MSERERTVAELMGWEPGARMRWQTEVVRGRDQCGPTPDDMLDWLLRQGWVVEIPGMHPSIPDNREVVVTRHVDGALRRGEAPTLHAALEAAVRAVAA